MRILLRDNDPTDPFDPAINRVLATAARHSLPVNVACTGRLDQARQLAARYSNTQLVIDHLGLPQPHEPPAPDEPFADLPKLLALAAHHNVAVKISGACALSHEQFPHKDVWDLCTGIEPGPCRISLYLFDQALRIIARWGPDRRRSGPHFGVEFVKELNTLSQFRGGVLLRC